MTSASSLRLTGFCKWLDSLFFFKFFGEKNWKLGQIDDKMYYSCLSFRLQPTQINPFAVNHKPSMLNCLHSSLCSFAFLHLCLSRPSSSIYCFVSSLVLWLLPGIGYAPQLMCWETPSVPVSWNTCPVMSCRGRTLSWATQWWRRQTRSRTSSSARRTSTRTRGVPRARRRCRGCG